MTTKQPKENSVADHLLAEAWLAICNTDLMDKDLNAWEDSVKATLLSFQEQVRAEERKAIREDVISRARAKSKDYSNPQYEGMIGCGDLEDILDEILSDPLLKEDE